ncbi:MAG: hypothetical protein CMF74_08415 [Maricaulis sp.]|nr:hypothetical protein [Maricaulis sp.]HAQ35928.1 hypothetical protein [Alphaproteobacteria bacterium]
MRIAAALAAMAITAAHAQAQDAETAFDGRSLAMALDDRCELYAVSERSALDASWLQARGVLIRSGYEPSVLTTRYAALSRRAQTMPCDSSDAQAIAADVAFAFRTLGRVREMDFPGIERVWRAERPYPEFPAWTLAQYPVAGDAGHVFGFFHAEGVRSLALGLPATSVATTARIVMRDAELSPALTDASLGGLLVVPGRPGWVRYAPPAHAEAVIWASARQSGGGMLRFEFPRRAVEALIALDPRETVRIETLDARGRVTDILFIEIGDFAAGEAFLSAGPGADSGAAGG